MRDRVEFAVDAKCLCLLLHITVEFAALCRFVTVEFAAEKKTSVSVLCRRRIRRQRLATKKYRPLSLASFIESKISTRWVSVPRLCRYACCRQSKPLSRLHCILRSTVTSRALASTHGKDAGLVDLHSSGFLDGLSGCAIVSFLMCKGIRAVAAAMVYSCAIRSSRRGRFR